MSAVADAGAAAATTDAAARDMMDLEEPAAAAAAAAGGKKASGGGRGAGPGTGGAGTGMMVPGYDPSKRDPRFAFGGEAKAWLGGGGRGVEKKFRGRGGELHRGWVGDAASA